LLRGQLAAMEQFDAAVFDVIMSFLNPEDACCMGCVSTRLRSLVEESLRWKEWCERACQSRKSSPAKELLSKHFSRAADAGPGYRRLYIKLATKRRPGSCSKRRYVEFWLARHVRDVA
jgi:hypothetical protein